MIASARPRNGTRDVTIVMYHYVRALQESRYPGVKGLDLAGFRGQIAYLMKHYHPVTVQEVVHSIRSGDALPPGAVLLTFDDGYLDHYLNVFPLLHDLGIQGAFFPPVAPVRDRVLLDVNRIHFILASAGDPHEVRLDLDHRIDRCRGEFVLPGLEDYWAQYGQQTRLDSAEVIYIKRMLQHALPEDLRRRIASELFSTYVALDEKAFAQELYMDTSQLGLMSRCGMYVGSHGVSHQWLNRLAVEEQISEVEGSLSFLRDIGSPVDDYWVMCFPYGGWNQSLLGELRRRNCTIGLTTEVAVANLDSNDSLLLPRLDTNDLPRDISAEAARA